MENAQIGQALEQNTTKTFVERTPQENREEEKSNQDMLHCCTIEIRCDSILNHMDRLKEGYGDFVPQNGFLLQTVSVSFTPGETVLDVLHRTTEQNGIQLLENGGYVQSIGYLIEGCCGRASGWMYTVNGRTPNYGCSQYKLQDQDKISWQFVCSPDDIITGR